MAVILIVDDEPLQREILGTILTEAGYETVSASSGAEALRLFGQTRPDVILSDLRMEDMDGMQLLQQLSGSLTETSLVMMTAFGTISSAVEAVKQGAFDYLTKPLDRDVLLMTVRRAVERVSLVRENINLQKELFGKFRIEGIVGSSSKMRSAVETVRKVARSPVTVLITGESGTGKELIARAIHYNSDRKLRAFTALNCAAIPENLFESELFGHEAGAFTGATGRKEGLFELSNGGTIFLDEIGDLPSTMQSKLLRVIQDKEVRRVGGKAPIKVDVRIITATNRDLEKEIGKGNFREDLYFRLKVFTIDLPPLRERREDIPELAGYFMRLYNREFGKRVREIMPAAMKALNEYHWPGNIRQLQSVLERAVLMNESGTIGYEEIAGELLYGKRGSKGRIELPGEGIDLELLERDLITQAMEKSGGVASKAAKLLGMSYKAFLYRLEKSRLSDDFNR